MRRFLAILLLVLAMPAAYAVQPDEVLPDPALEARARSLSAELRCLICQSQSIDDSDATIARDLRVLIRERLTAGDSDAAVKAYLVDRYSEYVLLRPTFSWQNAILWAAAPLMLLVGAVLSFGLFRRQRVAAAKPLTAEERRRLETLISEEDRG